MYRDADTPALQITLFHMCSTSGHAKRWALEFSVEGLGFAAMAYRHTIGSNVCLLLAVLSVSTVDVVLICLPKPEHPNPRTLNPKPY